MKRVTKGWTKNHWHWYDPTTDTNKVCLEGALFGYCESNKHELSKAQIEARDVVLKIVKERHGFPTIPEFNDAGDTTKDEVLEVLKLAIIRLETGGDEDGLDDEDVDDLLEFMEAAKST